MLIGDARLRLPQMLSFFSGRERTLREYTALLGKAGWKISHVQYTPGALSAYTTAVPV